MLQPNKEPSEFQKQMGRFPLYMRICWATLVVFGMVGNCAGHREQSLAILILVAVMWVTIRILVEGIEAYKILHLAVNHDKDDKKDPPPPATP